MLNTLFVILVFDQDPICIKALRNLLIYDLPILPLFIDKLFAGLFYLETLMFVGAIYVFGSSNFEECSKQTKL